MKSIAECISINALVTEVAADKEIRKTFAEATFENIPKMNWGRELNQEALAYTQKKFFEMAEEEDPEKRHRLFSLIIMLASLI